jgi:hypothetical protein
MTKRMRVLFSASIPLVAVILYLWGHSDGRAGRAPRPSGVSLAAENKAAPKYFPVENRARDICRDHKFE